MYVHDQLLYQISHVCFECSLNYSHQNEGNRKYLRGRNMAVYSTKIFPSGKLYYSSKACYHTSFEDPKASVISRFTSLLVRHVVSNNSMSLKKRHWNVFQQHMDRFILYATARHVTTRHDKIFFHGLHTFEFTLIRHRQLTTKTASLGLR
jgi:hypothetical protein